MGNTNLGLAMNHNETEVVEQRQINGEDPISAGLIDNIENNLQRIVSLQQ
jgi:hypothetical protein